MKRYNVANGDESAYYFSGFGSWFEADEALQFAKKHDPKAHVVKYEVQTERERLEAELETVKRERDFLLNYMANKSWAACDICKHAPISLMVNDCEHIRKVGVPCFEWIGLPEDEHGR